MPSIISVHTVLEQHSSPAWCPHIFTYLQWHIVPRRVCGRNCSGKAAKHVVRSMRYIGEERAAVVACNAAREAGLAHGRKQARKEEEEPPAQQPRRAQKRRNIPGAETAPGKQGVQSIML